MSQNSQKWVFSSFVIDVYFLDPRISTFFSETNHKLGDNKGRKVTVWFLDRDLDYSKIRKMFVKNKFFDSVSGKNLVLQIIGPKDWKLSPPRLAVAIFLREMQETAGNSRKWRDIKNYIHLFLNYELDGCEHKIAFANLQLQFKV